MDRKDKTLSQIGFAVTEITSYNNNNRKNVNFIEKIIASRAIEQRLCLCCD